MSSQSCWQILGIEPTQDQQLIRQAYRDLLPQYHPESDPEGFKRLREAYEQARKGVEAPATLLPFEQPTTAQDAPAADPTGLLAAFRTLITSHAERYLPMNWLRFISQLDDLPFTTIDQLRWPLLEAVLQVNYLSADCLLLLANRLQWRMRLSELDQEMAQQADGLLNYAEGGDIFDLSTLASLSLAAQDETLGYFHQIRHVYWEQPLAWLRYLLDEPRVMFWPSCPRLMAQVARWFNLAGESNAMLRDYCLSQHEQNPGDPEWLYLSASQCGMMGDNESALPLWLSLYEQHQHAEAEQWLLAWCTRYSPDYLPLLIQAFDRPDLPPAESAISDGEGAYQPQAQSPQTLVRWAEATRFTLSPLATDFISWKSGRYRPQIMFPHLLQEDGSDELLHFYWQTSMLTMGNEALLQAIIDQPVPEMPLKALILRGLQRQAAQRLAWLQRSPVLAEFNAWLHAPEALPLPEMFADSDSAAWKQSIAWLWHWRPLPPHSLSRLAQHPNYGDSVLPAHTSWLCYLIESVDMALPKDNQMSPRDALRQVMLLETMLELKADNITLLSQLNDFPLDEQHPLWSMYQVFTQIDPDQGDEVGQLKSHLQLSNSLHFNCWTRLPVSIEEYIARRDEISSYSAHYFYRHHPEWQERLAQSPFPYQALYHAVLLSHDNAQCAEENLDALEALAANSPEEAAFKQQLLLRQLPVFPADESLAAGATYALAIAEGIQQLSNNPEYLLDDKLSTAARHCADDPAMDIALRLAAATMLQVNSRRQKVFAQYPQRRSYFWQFWRVNSRLGRLGMVLQIVLGSELAILLVNAIVPEGQMPNTALSALLVVMNLYSAIVRRGRDLGLASADKLKEIKIPVLKLLGMYLFKRGMPEANRFGPPPGWLRKK
ncbi:DnaJ domain-containing protein [Pseudomonas graminis]